jgi:hypothetical protein
MNHVNEIITQPKVIGKFTKRSVGFYLFPGDQIFIHTYNTAQQAINRRRDRTGLRYFTAAKQCHFGTNG